jgi:gluconolactonase
MAIETLVGASPKIDKIATGFSFTEGPVFSRIGYLLFTDIPKNRIMKWQPGSDPSVFRENSNGANGLTFDHQGRLLTCEQNRITRTEKDGKITELAASIDGKTLASPNDLVYAIDGSIYFTVLRPRNAPQNSSALDSSVVCQITRKGQVRIVSRDCERPNGVALSPNQQHLLVADSGQKNVRIYDVNGDGSLKDGRVLCELKTDQPGGPDGLKTDEAGNIWVAGPGGIWVFDAKGAHLGTIAMPESPSNCAWGAGFHDLYVTARTSVYRVATTKVSGTRTF